MSEDLGTGTYAFPDKITRIFLEALDEVVGKAGMNAVMNLARLSVWLNSPPPPDFNPGITFAEMARLMAALEEFYGPRAGRELALRTGRACFKYGVQDIRGLLGGADVALRFMPLGLRMRIGLEVLAEIFNRYSDLHVTLGENAVDFFWVMDRCGFCWGRDTGQVACALPVGLIEETLYWISGGRRFAVEEISCVAAGESVCTVRISRQPLF